MRSVVLPNVDQFLYVGEYVDELKDSVVAVKYRNDRAQLPSMALRMAQLFRENIPPDVVLTWLPTSSEHIERRGFDHAHRLARLIGMYVGVAPKKVFSSRLGETQTGKARRERIGAPRFVIKNPLTVAHKTVVFIDDVCTTGATISAAARSAKAAGASSVCALVMAHTPPH